MRFHEAIRCTDLHESRRTHTSDDRHGFRTSELNDNRPGGATDMHVWWSMLPWREEDHHAERPLPQHQRHDNRTDGLLQSVLTRHPA